MSGAKRLYVARRDALGERCCIWAGARPGGGFTALTLKVDGPQRAARKRGTLR